MERSSNQASRDYFSIGIGSVFISTLKDASEWIGTIKSRPSDFVVREVSTDGIVADLALTADDIPEPLPRNKRKADKISRAEQQISSDDAMGKLLSMLGKTRQNAQDLISKLKAMDNNAKKETDSTVHPLIIDSLNDKELRTNLHVALATVFPLLDSQTIAGNSIKVTIDHRFDGLTPYLEHPTADLSLLGRFYRRIIPDQAIRLRLKEGLPRSDRRPVHRIIEEKTNRMLRTTTVEGAIKVSWARRKDDREQYLCVLRKVGLEHSAALSKVAKKLHCGRNDVTVAGVKDMFAVTFQFCAVAAKRQPQAIHLPDMDLLPLGPMGTQLNRGDLRGNRFEVIIRNLRCRDGTELGEKEVLHRISNTRRFVNFYGEQRVGEPGDQSVMGIRAQDIGRAMLQRNYSKAIDLMMTGRKAIRGKVAEIEEFRRVWKESSGDATVTLAVGGLPSKERTVLNGLKRFKDSLAALRCIPFHDRMMFINAVRRRLFRPLVTHSLPLVSVPRVEPCRNRALETLWMSSSGWRLSFGRSF